MSRRRRRMTNGGILVASDSFTRANSTNMGTTEVGAYAWTEDAATWSIDTNQALESGGPAAVSIDLGVVNHAVQGTYLNGDSYIAARIVDSGTKMVVGFPATNVLRLYKQLATTFTEVYNRDTGVSPAGKTLKLEVRGPLVVVYLNGIFETSYTITDATLLTGTKVGFHSGDSSRWDDFKAWKL